jgi:hypothetical protein
MTTMKTLFDWISWVFGAAFLLFRSQSASRIRRPQRQRTVTRNPFPTTTRPVRGSSRPPARPHRSIAVVHAPDVPGRAADHDAHARFARGLIADPQLDITCVWVYECTADAVGRRIGAPPQLRRDVARRSRPPAAAHRCRRQ